MVEINEEIRKKIFKSIYDFKINKKFWDYTGLTGAQHDTERSKPGPYLKKTAEIARILDLKNVVEIGSTRLSFSQKCLDYYNGDMDEYLSPPCCADGHGSIIWSLEGFKVDTVDINEQCIKQLQWSFGNIKREIPDNFNYHIPMDGIEFLKNYKDKIDILFLDGWDIGRSEYREKHLEAYQVVKDKLSDTHLILIDDTDFKLSDGGKDALLTPILIDAGYFMLFNGRQTLFINKI